jgi:hypothetical protein
MAATPKEGPPCPTLSVKAAFARSHLYRLVSTGSISSGSHARGTGHVVGTGCRPTARARASASTALAITLSPRPTYSTSADAARPAAAHLPRASLDRGHYVSAQSNLSKANVLAQETSCHPGARERRPERGRLTHSSKARLGVRLHLGGVYTLQAASVHMRANMVSTVVVVVSEKATKRTRRVHGRAAGQRRRPRPPPHGAHRPPVPTPPARPQTPPPRPVARTCEY